MKGEEFHASRKKMQIFWRMLSRCVENHYEQNERFLFISLLVSPAQELWKLGLYSRRTLAVQIAKKVELP